MRELKIGGTTVKYYNGSAKEMPSGRFKDFQRYLFEDWGIGTTAKDADNKLAHMLAYIGGGDPDKARQELINLRMTGHYIMQRISIKSYAFAILIADINGIAQTDYSEAGLANTVKLIEDNLSQQQLEQLLADVKKNSNPI